MWLQRGRSGGRREDPSAGVTERTPPALQWSIMARASLTGCPGGPSPCSSPRPPGGLLCPGRRVQSWTSRPSSCPVPEEQQGWSLRTPRAPPTQRMQSGAPRAPEPLQSGGGTRGGEHSGAQGTEAVGWVRAGIFCTRGTPAQGTAVPPSCLGLSGATSKRPPSLAGVVSLILCP